MSNSTKHDVARAALVTEIDKAVIIAKDSGKSYGAVSGLCDAYILTATSSKELHDTLLELANDQFKISACKDTVNGKATTNGVGKLWAHTRKALSRACEKQKGDVQFSFEFSTAGTGEAKERTVVITESSTVSRKARQDYDDSVKDAETKAEKAYVKKMEQAQAAEIAKLSPQDVAEKLKQAIDASFPDCDRVAVTQALAAMFNKPVQVKKPA